MPRQRAGIPVIHPETGELLELRRPTPRRAGMEKTGGPWYRMYETHTRRLYALRGAEAQVYFALITRLSENGPFAFQTKAIAEELGMVPANVSRCLRRLRELGILIDLPERLHLIDPRLAWFGSDTERERWVKDLDTRGLLIGTAKHPYLPNTPTPIQEPA